MSQNEKKSNRRYKKHKKLQDRIPKACEKDW